jgi:ribosomal protein S18 acetylase RimI-like enzyme
MVLDDLSRLPDFPLTSGYSFRGFRDGEEGLWAQIETSAGEFASVEQGIERFRGEFGGKQRELGERCLFVETESGEAVGTAMAWYGSLLPGGLAGRLHWVGVRREYQGRGIGRALVSRAMALLAARYDRVYLTTQRRSSVAIRIYLDFGFRPWLSSEAEAKEWRIVARQLGRSARRLTRHG